MYRLIVFTIVVLCFSCTNSPNNDQSSKKSETTYKNLKVERGRMYNEIKILDKAGDGKPTERIVKLTRETNDPVSPAMHELVKSGLKANGKNIRVDKIERDDDQWEIYFKSNKVPPKNLGKHGNYMVMKTLDNYIDHYDIFLDDELIYSTKSKNQLTKRQRDSLLVEERKVLLKDLDDVDLKTIKSQNHE